MIGKRIVSVIAIGVIIGTLCVGCPNGQGAQTAQAEQGSVAEWRTRSLRWSRLYAEEVSGIVVADAVDRQTVQLQRIADALERQANAQERGD